LGGPVIADGLLSKRLSPIEKIIKQKTGRLNDSRPV